jgi:hypothetical protein
MVTQTSDMSDAKISIGQLTTKNFYLELKKNLQFHRPLSEQITIRLPAPPMTNGNNYMYEQFLH